MSASFTTLILVLLLRNVPNFLVEATHQSNPRPPPPYNQEPLISTYQFSPSSSANPSPTTNQKVSSQQSASSSAGTATAHYLAYHPSPAAFYHQNVYLTSPPGSSSSSAAAGVATQPSGISTSYSYGFGAPGATNLYTYGSGTAANSPQLMLASGSSPSQAVMATTVPAGHHHQESKMLLAGEQLHTDKNSKSPLGIVFGRPLSGYDGNFYVPVFYPLAWLGTTANAAAAATTNSQTDPMAAFPSTSVSTSSLPATPYASPFTHHHHHHPRPHSLSSYSSFHHPSSIFSYPSQQFHTGMLPTASKLSSSPATTATTQPLYRLMLPVHAQASPSAIYRSPTPSYHQMISNSLGSASVTSGQLKSADEMMPSDVTPDINGNFKRTGAHSHLLHHHHHHQYHPHQVPHSHNQTPMDDGDDAGSYFFGDPTPLLRGTGYSDQPADQSAPGSSSMATAESANSPQSYYYIAPVIKYRDPKDDYNLAIEASKEQLSAQKRFEKEVLMAEDDELLPASSSSSSSEQSFLTIEEQLGSDQAGSQLQSQSGTVSPYLNPRSGVTANGSADYAARIESRSSSDTQPAVNERKSTASAKASSSVNSKPPILTSIEIFDLPGANKYLGLDHSSSLHQQTTENGASLPVDQIVRPAAANQTDTKDAEVKPLRTASSLVALPASKFYRRKLSTTAVTKTEGKTVK